MKMTNLSLTSLTFTAARIRSFHFEKEGELCSLPHSRKAVCPFY
jgi:hypothetical protein